MPKRHCTSRAEWRLQPGKPAEPLSAHYRLDCDYGTAVVTCWEDGGSEPIYVCESHSKLMWRSREHCSDVRIVAAPSDHSGNAINSEDRTEIREIVCTKPVCASSEAARSDVDVKIGLAMPDPPARVPVRDSTYGNSAKAMVDEAICRKLSALQDRARPGQVRYRGSTSRWRAVGRDIP